MFIEIELVHKINTKLTKLIIITRINKMNCIGTKRPPILHDIESRNHPLNKYNI